MNKYVNLFTSSFSGYANYLYREITNPHWGNYFYWLIGLSLFFLVIEQIFPWRKNQKLVRKDFYLDVFYMFFNFFLFSLIGYAAIADVFVALFDDGLKAFGYQNLVAVKINDWPYVLQLFVLFIIKDFIHFNIHRLLHKVPFLWEFHKVHHSVEEMGFAAHLRFHWMETVVYKSITYIPLAMIGFGIDDFLLVHLFTIAVGHYNHSNTYLSLGTLKYIFNNPQMHIWHHAKNIPHKNGVNFGITLSIWDYLFGTNYIPKSGRDEKLGFQHLERFPSQLWKQLIYPFNRKPKKSYN